MRLTVNVEELWHNTYIKGRKYTNPLKNIPAGWAWRKTAALWNNGQNPEPKDTPLYHFFLSDDCGRFQGIEHTVPAFLKSYIPRFKEIFESIKTHGYIASYSSLPVEIIDGEPYLFDGNRRIACIIAIGKQKEIPAIITDYKVDSKKCRFHAEKALQISYLKSEGKKILYQPILDAGLDDYSTDTFRNSYRLAFDILLDICGNVEKKRVLDIGCAYGYYSREFAKAGAYVTAVEKNGMPFGLCRSLARLYPNMDWSNPLFVHCDISRYIQKTGSPFDFTLMLNVFNHIYAQGDAVAWETLNKIARKSEYILLTTSVDKLKNIGKQEDIPSLIMENSILNTYKDFGAIPPFGRHLFGFWR